MSSQQAWRLQQARRGTGTVERVGPSAPGPIRREGAGAGMPEHRVSASAINLDGGGSTTLVHRRRLLNRP
jgi:hypothetical protein